MKTQAKYIVLLNEFLGEFLNKWTRVDKVKDFFSLVMSYQKKGDEIVATDAS